MTVATRVDLERLTKEMFRHFDRSEFDAVAAMFDSTVQGVDEISRDWMRGKSSIDAYFAKLAEASVDGMSTKIGDFHSELIGDVGIVTCKLDQTYEIGGAPQRVVAPATLVFRKRGDEWCIALVHAVALPDQAA